MTKKVSMTLFISPHQMQALQNLKRAQGVPIAELIRQGVDAALEKNKHLLEERPMLQFEVWLHPETGYALLLSTASWGEITPFRDTGFILKEKFAVLDEMEAQQKFGQWCRERNLHAQIKKVPFVRLKS